LSKLGFSKDASHERWLATTIEQVLEPSIEIVDAHHHLWHRPDGGSYLFPEFLADLNQGHRVISTVYAECHSMYRTEGEEQLKSVGESEFVAGVSAMSASGNYGETAVCQVMFAHTDMTLGNKVNYVLDAHDRASGGRLRGVRISCGWDKSPKIRNVAPGPGMLSDGRVVEASRILERRKLSLDVWLYHPQIVELAGLAAACPELTLILNHVGSPILGGPYRNQSEQVMQEWSEAIKKLAQHENVFVKLGALPIRLNKTLKEGYNPEHAPGSAEVAATWRPWIEGCIDAFGPSRCMFESNFPVQKNWCSYLVVWNAYKRIAAEFSPDTKAKLFAETARRAYRM